MSTISELIVAAKVDPTGMQQGYTRGEQLTMQFAQSVNRIMAGTLGATQGQGGASVGQTAAENLIAGLREGFDNRKGVLREMLARGVIDQKQYEAMGREAGASFNRGLLTGVDELQKKGLLTDDIRNQMVGEFEVAGAASGRTFAQSLTATIHRHRALIPTLAGLIIGQAASSAGDVASAGGGLDKTIAQGKAAEKILENVAMLASFLLEPIPGLIAAVVGGAAAAVVKIWTHAKEETAKARKEFVSELTQTARGDDLSGIARMKQYVFSGDPFAAIEGKREGESATVYNARRLGIQGVTAEIERLKTTLQAVPKGGVGAVFAGGGGDAQKVLAHNREVNDQITEMTKSLTLLNEENSKIEPVWQRILGNQPGGSKAVRDDMMRGFAIASLTDDVGLMTSAWQRATQVGLKPSEESVARMLEAHRATVTLLDQEADKTGKNAKALQQTRDSLEDIFNKYTQLNTMPPRNDDVLIGAAQGAGEEPARRSITIDLESQRTLMTQLYGLRDAIRARIEEEGGALHANLQLVIAQRDIEAQILANRTLAGPPKPMPGAFDNIRETVARSQAMSSAAAAAAAVGAGNAGELEAAANAQRQRAIGLIRGMLEATDGQTASTKEGRQALEDLLNILNQVGDVSGKGASGFDGMKNAIRGVLDAAGGFGKVGQDISQAGRSVLHMVDAMQALKKARDAQAASGGMAGGLATLGAGIGVVGGIIGAIGAVKSLFGESPEEAERKQILRQNNDRLRELRLSIDGNLRSASATARISGNVNMLAEDARSGQGRGPIGAIDAMIKTMKDANAMGAGFDEVKQKAKDLGIELFDSKGHLLIGAFQQLADALELERKRMMQFTDSFEDQKTLSDLMGRVMGKTAPADQYNGTLALLQRFAPALAKGLDGIDATTEDGRKKIEAALQALVAQLMAGSITLEQYGDLEGAKQLADIIAMLQDSLDGMKTAVDSVTGSLNVPDWYKINAARVNAANPLGMPTGADSGPGVGTGGVGVSFIPAGSGAIGAGPQDRGVTIVGDVYVDAHELSADEIFAAVVKAGRRKASLQFGNPSRWSDVQE